MNNAEIIERYFQWLVDQVCYKTEKKSYNDVLRLLFATTFKFSIERDGNRAADGVDLRSQFAECYNLDFETRHDAITGPCSLLEMLVALCDRAVFSMVDCENSEEFDEKHDIFWLMMKNLGLVALKNGDFSHSKAIRRINIFMDRKYASNGSRGGLFVVKKPRKDLREVEIWYQMCWYFSENLKFD